MRIKGMSFGRSLAKGFILSAFGAAWVAACATGVDPVRPGGSGGGGGSPSGPGPTSADSSSVAVTSSSSVASTSSSASSSSSAVSSSSSSSSAAASSSGAGGAAASSSSASGAGGAAASSSSVASSSSSGGPVNGLKVQYLCANTNVSDKEIKPHFSIVNGSQSTVSLSDLKIRYYFTLDVGSPTLTMNCDYAAPGAGACGNITSSFGMVAGAMTDHYLEVGFVGQTLAPGAATGEIQARFHDVAYQSVFDQSNDYSFDPSKLAFADWDHVTLYQSGSLVWGVEP